MREPERDANVPQPGKKIDIERQDEPSLYVANLIHRIQKRQTEAATQCVKNLSSHSGLTPSGFAIAVSKITDEGDLRQLASAFYESALQESDFDSVQGVPGLIALAHNLISGNWSEVDESRGQVEAVLERLMDDTEADPQLLTMLRIQAPPTVRADLEAIVRDAPQHRAGYWNCVELLATLNPSQETLGLLCEAARRVLDPEPGDQELSSFRRAVGFIGQREFSSTFEHVARWSQKLQSESEFWFYSASVLGLSDLAWQNVSEVGLFMMAGKEEESIMACKLCMLAGSSYEYDLPVEIRNELSEKVRELINMSRYSEMPERHVSHAYRALAHTTTSLDDLEVVSQYIEDRWRRGDSNEPETVWSYADGLARLHDVNPVEPLDPHEDLKFVSKSRRAKARGSSAEESRLSRGATLLNVFESFALELASGVSKREVLRLCEKLDAPINPDRLLTREEDCLNLFSASRQALAFVKRHDFLARKGPVEVVAALVPELLSAFNTALIDADPHRSSEIFDRGEDVLRFVASVGASDPQIRQIIINRLSTRDREFLADLSVADEEGKYAVDPSVVLASLALRAVIDDTLEWQDQLVRFAGSLSTMERFNLPQYSIPFVSIVAERRRSGAVVELIQKAPLDPRSGHVFRQVTHGASINVEKYSDEISRALQSDSAIELARAFLLSQVLVEGLTAERRTQVLEVARRSLDEYGILSIDAIATLSALSSSREDAYTLLHLEPSIGVYESLHRVTCVKGVARILRNAQDQKTVHPIFSS